MNHPTDLNLLQHHASQFFIRHKRLSKRARTVAALCKRHACPVETGPHVIVQSEKGGMAHGE